MIGWGRFHSARATTAAVPLAGAVDIVPLSPPRCRPGCSRSGRPMTFTGVSAVQTGRTGRFLLAVRSHRAMVRRPYRPEALIPCGTGRAAGAGLVAPTGRKLGGGAPCRTGRTFPGGPTLPTGRRFRPVSSRPYRSEGGPRRAGHGAVPSVHMCRPRSSWWFWWSQHN
jgi:hypothetical protein